MIRKEEISIQEKERKKERKKERERERKKESDIGGSDSDDEVVGKREKKMGPM